MFLVCHFISQICIFPFLSLEQKSDWLHKEIQVSSSSGMDIVFFDILIAYSFLLTLF